MKQRLKLILLNWVMLNLGYELESIEEHEES
jgi:hypothetical protein